MFSWAFTSALTCLIRHKFAVINLVITPVLSTQICAVVAYSIQSMWVLNHFSLSKCLSAWIQVKTDRVACTLCSLLCKLFTCAVYISPIWTDCTIEATVLDSILCFLVPYITFFRTCWSRYLQTKFIFGSFKTGERIQWRWDKQIGNYCNKCIQHFKYEHVL